MKWNLWYGLFKTLIHDQSVSLAEKMTHLRTLTIVVANQASFSAFSCNSQLYDAAISELKRRFRRPEINVIWFHLVSTLTWTRRCTFTLLWTSWRVFNDYNGHSMRWLTTCNNRAVSTFGCDNLHSLAIVFHIASITARQQTPQRNTKLHHDFPNTNKFDHLVFSTKLIITQPIAPFTRTQLCYRNAKWCWITNFVWIVLETTWKMIVSLNTTAVLVIANIIQPYTTTSYCKLLDNIVSSQTTTTAFPNLQQKHSLTSRILFKTRFLLVTHHHLRAHLQQTSQMMVPFWSWYQWHWKWNSFISTYAFLDSRSTCSWLLANVANNLQCKITGPAVKLNIGGFHESKSLEAKIVSAKIHPFGNIAESFTINHAFVLPSFNLADVDTHFLNAIFQQFHLQWFNFPRLLSNQIGLILGLDKFDLITAWTVLKGPPNAPRAVLTNINWTTGGPFESCYHQSTFHATTFHCLTSTDNYHDDDDLYDLLASILRLENFGIVPELTMSKEGKHALKTHVDTIRFVDNKYEVG